MCICEPNTWGMLPFRPAQPTNQLHAISTITKVSETSVPHKQSASQVVQANNSCPGPEYLTSANNAAGRPRVVCKQISAAWQSTCKTQLQSFADCIVASVNQQMLFARGGLQAHIPSPYALRTHTTPRFISLTSVWPYSWPRLKRYSCYCTRTAQSRNMGDKETYMLAFTCHQHGFNIAIKFHILLHRRTP